MLYVCIFHEYPIKKLCLANKNLINASVDDAELAINRLFTVLKAAKQENYLIINLTSLTQQTQLVQSTKN